MLAGSIALLTAALTFGQAPPARLSAAIETPSQAYLRFRAVVRTAASIDEITPFWGADLMHEFSMLPDADKPAILDTVKRIEAMTADVKVTKETRTPAGVTLSLHGIGPDKKPKRGEVALEKEDGVWKLAGQEEWAPTARSPEPDRGASRHLAPGR